jgi:hypothetical protein
MHTLGRGRLWEWPDGWTTEVAMINGAYTDISDFERRLQLVDADRFDHTGATTGMNGAGPGRFFNP